MKKLLLALSALLIASTSFAGCMDHYTQLFLNAGESIEDATTHAEDICLQAEEDQYYFDGSDEYYGGAEHNEGWEDDSNSADPYED